MAEWWETDALTEGGEPEPDALTPVATPAPEPAANWWEGDEIAAAETPAEEDTKPRGLLDVLVDAFSQEEVITTPEAATDKTEAQYVEQFKQLRGTDVPGIYVPAAEMIAMFVTGAVAEPIAGLAGMAASVLPGEAGQGADVVEATRQALTYEPSSEKARSDLMAIGTFLAPVGEALSAVETGLGETVLEATGSEFLATVAHTAPTALIEALGLGVLRKGSRAAQAAAEAQRRIKIDPKMTPDDVAREMLNPEQRTYQQIAKDLRAGKAEGVAKEVRPDYEILRDAEEFGVDLTPGAYSTNEAFIRVEQALKSRPGSELAAREVEALQQLGRKADELIDEFGGVIDKGVLDLTVQARITGTIKELGTKAEFLYKRVNDKISPRTKVRMRASDAYINQRLKDLGGDKSLLTTAERKLMRMMQADRPPTYNALDTMRRDIGAGYNRRGPFKDDAGGTLDQVYGALIRDQQGIAQAYKVGAEFSAARKLVESRKGIEKAATKLLGNDLGGSIIPKINQAATALTKGDMSHFKRVMKAVPEDLRQTVAATMLNDLFTLGARSKGAIGDGFANAYQGLQRNPSAKVELFKYLPKEAQRRFDALGRMSTGVIRARQLENTSKTARDVLAVLESGGMAETVYGKVRPLLYYGGAGVMGMAADVATAAVKGQAKRVTKADDLLNSPVFERSINKAMEGSVKEAETMLKRSSVWRAFRATLGEGTKAQLAAIGPIAWLTQSAPQPEEAAPVPEDAMLAADQTSPEAMPPRSPPPAVIAGVQ